MQQDNLALSEESEALPFRAVDLFCGGGGASEGIRIATGHAPWVAVNHCEHAIEMHEANHPNTIHLRTGVHDVTPMHGPSGRPIDLLWLSPDCTHFSRARNGKPRKKSIRDLAWVAVDWAAQVKPRVIALENVPEFLTWGPLYPPDHPVKILQNTRIKERSGETFRAFVSALESHGYQVDWRVLVAADYGSPTTRKRLFLIARRDAAPVWPKPSHGPGLLPYRTAAECIDWSIPCPSIFARRRPLVEKTLARIAEGLRRYVLTSDEPYIVPGGIGYGIQTRNGERPGQTPRTFDPRKPYNTITAKGSQGGVAIAHLTKFYGTSKAGADITNPMPTVTSGGGHIGLVSVHIQSTHSSPTYRAADKPLATITASFGGHQSIIQAQVVKHEGSVAGPGLKSPVELGVRTDRSAQVAAFVNKYLGDQWQAKPGQAHTIEGKDYSDLVTIEVDGELWIVVDIGMRMMQPRELATAQGFGREYILTGNKSQQVARIGNSVPPQVVAAIVSANQPRKGAIQ